MFFRLVSRTFGLMPACAYLKDCAIENICGDLFNFVLCIITINILDILFYIYIYIYIYNAYPYSRYSE